MLSTLKSAWKMDELRKKIIFTLMMFIIFRIGAHVPVPGVNTDALKVFWTKIFWFHRYCVGELLKVLPCLPWGLCPH